MIHFDYHSIRFTRRQALIAGGLGTIGLSLPQLLSAEDRTRAQGQKSIILVVPWGGASQHDTFDPKPEAPAEVRSLFQPIATRTIAMRMGEHLPRLARISDRFSVLRAVSHHISTHNPATHLALTGYPPRIINQQLTRATRADFPTIGSILAKIQPSRRELPSYVQLPMAMIDNGAYTNGQNAGFLGPAYDPLVVAPDHSSGNFRVVGATPRADVGPGRFDSRRDLLQQLDSCATHMNRAPSVQDMASCYARAYGVLRSAASSQAFDISREPGAMRDRYGRGIGQSMLTARRLVEAGVRLVLVADTTENTNGKWDTHGDLARQLPRHLRESDQIATLACYPHAELWKNHLGFDDSTLAGFAALGVKNNPKFRICWQTYIWPVGKEPKDGKKTLDMAATKKRAARELLQELEKLVDAINEKHGRKVVLISPASEATLKLVDMVADGKFPGITDPADLWLEFNMHSNRHLLALTAYCNVATMHGISPVGLKPSFMGIIYATKGGQPHYMDGITDEQNAILQRIAWETVSRYPYAGIARTK